MFKSSFNGLFKYTHSFWLVYFRFTGLLLCGFRGITNAFQQTQINYRNKDILGNYPHLGYGRVVFNSTEFTLGQVSLLRYKWGPKDSLITCSVPTFLFTISKLASERFCFGLYHKYGRCLSRNFVFFLLATARIFVSHSTYKKNS